MQIGTSQLSVRYKIDTLRFGDLTSNMDTQSPFYLGRLAPGRNLGSLGYAKPEAHSIPRLSKRKSKSGESVGRGARRNPSEILFMLIGDDNSLADNAIE